MEEIITSFVVENKEFLLKNLPWYLIGGWTVYSLLIILSKSIREIISTYLIIQTIPNVFVTLGLFGTFCGIVFGFCLSSSIHTNMLNINDIYIDTYTSFVDKKHIAKTTSHFINLYEKTPLKIF